MSPKVQTRNVSRFAAAGVAFALLAVLLLITGARAEGVIPDGVTPNSPDIVGGQLASDGEWPWQVALIQFGANPYDGQFCGGSLIAAGWVLTAAHCVVDNGDVTAPSEIQVLAGIHDLGTPDAGYQRINIQQIIPHPGYVESTYDQDLALLRLSTNAVLGPTAGGQNVAVVPLVAAGVGDLVGTMADITGWGNTGSGYPTQLMEARVPIVSKADCNDSNSYNGDITDNMMCAGYAAGGVDTCQGDSGGPLVVGSPSDFRLAGITSWGTGCAQPNKYGVYTRVSRYVGWITGYLNPAPAPTITSFTPTSGVIGTVVTIDGTNLGGTTLVKFNGVAATTFSVVSATRVTAKVPTGATTGKVSVTTPSGTATSTGNFTVTGPAPTYRAYLPMGIHLPPQPPPTPIRNGNFEQGHVAWTEYSSHDWPLIMNEDDLAATPQGGSWAAWLGGEVDEISRLSQTITIPAATPYLSFYHLIASEDACGFDYARVLLDSNKVYEVSLCGSSNTGGWTRRTINLSAYAGRTMKLMFEVETDDSQNSNWFIDTVSFTASGRDEAEELPAAPADPTLSMLGKSEYLR